MKTRFALVLTMMACMVHSALSAVTPKAVVEGSPEIVLDGQTFRVWRGELGFREMPATGTIFNIPPERVAEIAAMLPEKPRGLVPNYKDRNFWEKEYPDCRGMIDYSAKTMVNKKLAPIPLETFPVMLTSPERDKRGERPGYYDWWYGSVYDCFRILARMTVSECQENKGRFVPKIVEAMQILLEMPTWDIDPRTLLEGLRYFESHSAMVASNLALAGYLLDDKLPQEVRARLAERIDEWALTPAFRSLAVTHEQRRAYPHTFWYDVDSNMNPYFYNYLLQVTQVSLESRQERAWFIANALEAMKCYFRRYTKDGYITEGMGYWFMGLSNVALVDFAIRKATGERESVFKGDYPGPGPLSLGCKMTMVPGMLVYPHFGDYGVDGRPWTLSHNHSLTFISFDLAAGRPNYNDYIEGRMLATYGGVILSTDLDRTMSAIELCRRFPGIILPVTEKETLDGYFGRITPDYGKRFGTAEKLSSSFFANDQDCGILISRDLPGSKPSFALATKGGNNGEGHGHDDCGSYCIALGDCIVLGDSGVPVYYHATQKRAKQSYAHPVPYPDGTIQTTGSNGYSKVLEFKDDGETASIAYDLTHAYATTGLKSLVRSFVHDRKARRIAVTDTFEYDAPKRFETALTSYGKPKELSPGVWELDGLRIEFHAKGGDLEFQLEELDVLMRNERPINRLACRLSAEAASGEISYTLAPKPEP